MAQFQDLLTPVQLAALAIVRSVMLAHPGEIERESPKGGLPDQPAEGRLMITERLPEGQP